MKNSTVQLSSHFLLSIENQENCLLKEVAKWFVGFAKHIHNKLLL